MILKELRVFAFSKADDSADSKIGVAGARVGKGSFFAVCRGCLTAGSAIWQVNQSGKAGLNLDRVYSVPVSPEPD